MFYIFLSLFHISEIYTWAPSYFWLQSRKTCKVINLIFHLGVFLLREGKKSVLVIISCVWEMDSLVCHAVSWHNLAVGTESDRATNIFLAQMCVLILQFTSVLNFSWLPKALAFLSFFLTLLRPDLLSHAFIKKTSVVL